MDLGIRRKAAQAVGIDLTAPPAAEAPAGRYGRPKESGAVAAFPAEWSLEDYYLLRQLHISSAAESG